MKGNLIKLLIRTPKYNGVAFIEVSASISAPFLIKTSAVKKWPSKKMDAF